MKLQGASETSAKNNAQNTERVDNYVGRIAYSKAAQEENRDLYYTDEKSGTVYEFGDIKDSPVNDRVICETCFQLAGVNGERSSSKP